MGRSYYDSQSLHRPILYFILAVIWLNGSISQIRAETERYDIVRFSKVTTNSHDLWPREQVVRSQMNRPFPSSQKIQNEGRCSAFDMEIIFHSHAINLIFTRKVVHLASF